MTIYSKVKYDNIMTKSALAALGFFTIIVGVAQLGQNFDPKKAKADDFTSAELFTAGNQHGFYQRCIESNKKLSNLLTPLDEDVDYSHIPQLCVKETQEWGYKLLSSQS